MKESNLKIAQKDIDDALKTVEDIVSVLDNTDLPKNVLKEKFVTLTEKVLKTEGIL